MSGDTLAVATPARGRHNDHADSQHTSLSPPPLLVPPLPHRPTEPRPHAVHPSPAKRLKLSVTASASILHSSEPSPRSRAEEEALAMAFHSSCRCGAGSAPLQLDHAAPLHVHLDVAGIQAALAGSLLPLPLAVHGRLVSAPVTAAASASDGAGLGVARCHCIPLPPSRVAAPSTTSSSHKRRHVSPPLTPVALSSHQLHSMSLKRNEAVAASASPPAVTTAHVPILSSALCESGRTIVRVVKRQSGGSGASSAGNGQSNAIVTQPSSPHSSLTVELPQDEQRDGLHSDSASPHSSSSSPLDQLDSPLPAPPLLLPSAAPTPAASHLGTPVLLAKSATAAVFGSSVSAAAAAAAGASTSSVAASLLHDSSSWMLECDGGGSGGGAGAGSGSGAAADSPSDELDAECAAAHAASLREIMAIEAEEEEAELNFLMQTMNQHTAASMPYIL